jgi:hypothetical protein
MPDPAGARSQVRGDPRKPSRSGSGKPYCAYDSHEGGYQNEAQNGDFGRDFGPQHDGYAAGGEGVQELRINGNTPHSESSESERIAAVHRMTNGDITSDVDTLSLHHMMAETQGQIGYWRKVWAQPLKPRMN